MLKVKLKGREVRKMLAQKHMTQNWLANKIGVTSGHMAQLLNGDKNPSPKTRVKIQTYFKEKAFEELFRFIN